MGTVGEYEVLGGESALDRTAHLVTTGSSLSEVGRLPAGALAVFSRAQLAMEEPPADIAIRRAVTAGLAGLIAETPRSGVPVVTRRLAEKFAFPVILLPHVDPAALAGTLDPLVRAPALAAANTLRTAVERMLRLPRDQRDLVQRLADLLRTPVALIDGSGRVLQAGGEAEPVTLVALTAGLEEVGTRSRIVDLDGGGVAVISPATLQPGAPSNLWLVALLSPVGAAMADTVRTVLSVAALAFSVYVADQGMRVEREERQRALLLAEILEHGDNARARSIERATALGWRLFGWHNAIQIGVHAGGQRLPGELNAFVEEELRRAGIDVGLVARPVGSAFWITRDRPASPADIAEIAAVTRRVLIAVGRAFPGIDVRAGVGGTHSGISGIGTSLHEAQQALMLARTRDVAAAVELTDSMSVNRLLLGWYQAGPMRDTALSLIEPVRKEDPSGVLLRTLRCFLDHESSTTTTAAVLGVHRNTVVHRMGRIRRLLPVDLDAADERLAVQLAVRVYEGVADVEDPPERLPQR
ncbi:helix-turn-helix domain-containing protein [Streptosporangium sp. NPDC051022]|uniref:PucR family transcriptional regulator n=1 Tax=Streptosporangium sp. NPDC051022 TaxID=3155752 RepID=UPI00343C7317